MRLVLSTAALLLPLALPLAAAAADPAPAPPAPARLRVTDRDLIAKAVRETLAETPPAPLARNGRSLSADAQGTLGRAFDEAQVPGCLRPDGLKLQPPRIGPVGVGGLLALPFLALAAVRGKCN